MSILTKVLDKIRKSDNETDTRCAEVRMPLSAQGHSMASSPNNGSNSETISQSGFEIDIRLDQDLTDFAKQQKQSRYKEADLDFDLDKPGSEGLSFIETQILKINPTRSFSQKFEVKQKTLCDAGFITPGNYNSILSNSFRALKRPVLNNVMGKGATVLDNANLIMLTSSFEGEGKTFSAINMALSIAMEKDKRVLLIDADVNKPSHHKYFGLEMDHGLTDLLLEQVDDVSKVIYKTNIPSLSLMFAGNRTPHATELFASNAMQNFVNDLSSRYEDRIIIFDSAPLLLPTEASVLASHMGQIILVVEAEQTRHESVMKSLEMLSNRIVLLLLNKMQEKNDQGSYGYHANHED
jgi:protein-tyrosine kinase